MLLLVLPLLELLPLGLVLLQLVLLEALLLGLLLLEPQAQALALERVHLFDWPEAVAGVQSALLEFLGVQELEPAALALLE